MKRILVTLLGLMLLGVGATAVANAAASRPALDLAVDGQHATRTFVDAAPKHTRRAPLDSPGDTVVLHAPLLDRRGARVGTIDCTFVTTASGTDVKHDGSEQLSGTLRLARGQISVLGNVGAFTRTTQVAIVGGTGKYAGARGDVTALFTQRAVKLHLSFS